jgi:hypothetical protein
VTTILHFALHRYPRDVSSRKSSTVLSHALWTIVIRLGGLMEAVVRRGALMKDHRKPNRQDLRNSSRWTIRLYDSLEGIESTEDHYYVTFSEDETSELNEPNDRAKHLRSDPPKTD